MITNNKGSPVPPLRDYQQEALARMQHYEGRAALLVLATGLGKTRIFTEFLRWEVNENDHHCLILSHREELVHQPLTYLQDLTCGVELADKRANHEPIISASVQSLVSRLDKYNPREIDTIIVDEAHHAAAPTYRRILDYFQNAQIFGFSATPHRGDGVGLGCVFEDIIYDKDVLWAIKNNYLAPIKCRQVNLKYDMGKVKIREDTNDYDQTAVARVMSGTAAGVVEAYNKYAKGPTIIFAASLDEVRDITHLINKQSNSKIAAAVTAATPDRDRLLEAYTLGLIKVLVNYSIFTEGTDLPATETIIIARPIAPTNVGLYAQIVGRGLRPYPGKPCCNVIDCVGISDYPICTAATLIGDEPKEPQPQKAKQEQMADSEEQIEVLPAEKIPDAHLLIRTSKTGIEPLEAGMKSLCIRYAAYYNRKYERIGTLFQDRYKSQPVTTVGYFLRVLRYIHNNPVAAGITDTMADYPWSSYRDYFATRSTCICKVHTEYAMQIKTHDELLQWHTKTEINTRGILDVDNSKSKVSDAEINHIITILTGMPAAQLQRLPEEKQAQVFQRLIDEESIGFSQLARLTGIEKGRIKRLIL